MTASDNMFGYSEKAAARILDVTPRTLRSWRAAGSIGYYRLPGGRVRYGMEHIIEFQRACHVAPDPDVTRFRAFPHASAQR